MPAFLALIKKVDPTYSHPNNSELAKWRDDVVDAAFATPLFKMAPEDHKRLKKVGLVSFPYASLYLRCSQAAKKIYVNKYASERLNYQRNHGAGHDPVACHKGMTKLASALVKLKSFGRSGKTFFKEQHRDEIRQTMEDMDCANGGGAFEKALTELWEAEPDHEEWEAKANAAIDITGYDWFTLLFLITYGLFVETERNSLRY